MKTPFAINQGINRMAQWVATSLLVIGCAQSELSGLKGYQAKARITLEGYAQGVSRSFSGQRGSRGFTDASGFGVDRLYEGSVLNPNLHADTFDCFEEVEYIQARPENYIGMVAKFSRCLNRMLVEGNPLMSYGYRNLDPMSQQYYTYLLNWRRFGTLEGFSPGDFGLLSQFAGRGQYSLGGSGFSLTPR